MFPFGFVVFMHEFIKLNETIVIHFLIILILLFLRARVPWTMQSFFIGIFILLT